jgi:hypothetical protein
MKTLRTFFLTVVLLCCITVGFAQQAYTPFKYDAENFVLSLNVKASPWTKKFAPVLQKHSRNPKEASEWSGLFDTILGMNATDLYTSGHITIDNEDDLVKITATDNNEVSAVMNVLKSVIATPEKLEAFLAEFDATLDHADAKKKSK